MVALRRIWLRLKVDQTRKDQAPGATFLKFVVGPKMGWVPSNTSSLVMVAMLTLLGTGAIINEARLSLCKIAMVDARSVPRYNVLTKVGFVIWERGPMSWRVSSCLSLLMATEMRLSGVHVAWAHGIDDSKMAGTVNTHCWKVARVVFGFLVVVVFGRQRMASVS